jgi:hypothetical protein
VEIKTRGYRPVIIDWGMANVTRGVGVIRGSFDLTWIGLFPFQFDRLRDIMILMRSAADHMSDCGRRFADSAALTYYNTTINMWSGIYETNDLSIFKNGRFTALDSTFYAFLHRRADDDAKATMESVALVAILLAHVNLPLVRRVVTLTSAEAETCASRRDYDIAWAVSSSFLRLIRHYDLKAVDVKNIVDTYGWRSGAITIAQSTTLLNSDAYDDLKEMITRLIEAFTNVLLGYVGSMERDKSQRYGLMADETMLSCLRQLRNDPIDYAEGMRVAFYDCGTGQRTAVKTLTTEDARMYNRQRGGIW